MLHRLFWIVLGLSLPGLLSAQTIINVTTAAQLQSAFSTVPNGGVIELAAGTYLSPANGFTILDPNKTFTVRAATGATVALDGGGTRLVLRYQSNTAGSQGHVTFQDLIFRNGRSTENARGAGITQQRGRAVFLRCVVENNHSTVGGSGYWGYGEADSWWIDSIIRNNTSFGSGAGLRMDIGTMWIHNSTLLNNRTNVPGHAGTAVGGGIHFYDAKGFITNSRFEGNQSVWAGGALYGIGTFEAPFTTPKTDIVVANCTFIDNSLSFQPGAAPPTPGEGGAIHIENQVRLRVFNSRLLKNRAPIGGGISLFRSTAIIEDSVLRGNQATDTVSTSGFGGAIKANSDDAPGINYPSASVTVRDTLIQGRYDGVTTVARGGGGIFVAGDTNRAYGANGVTQGTLAESRARLILERVTFNDLDVSASGGGAVGGAIQLACTDFDGDDLIFSGNDALGAGSGGGAMLLLQDTLATVTNSVFSGNTAVQNGGAIFAKGVDLQVSNSQFLANAITGGNLLGGAIFTEPQPALGALPNINMTGTIASNVFSGDIGLTIFDSEVVAPPINDIRYNSNQFFSSAQNQADHPTGSGTAVYGNPIAVGGVIKHSPSALNSLVIPRPSPNPSTDKSQVDNTALGTAPKVAKLLAMPSQILTSLAVGDAGVATPAYLAWATAGGAATLDSAPLATAYGVVASDVGPHTLSVSPVTDVATIDSGETPAIAFGASPDAIPVGGSTSLSWNLTSGTYITATLSNGLGVTIPASGAVTAFPPQTTTYRLYLATEEGGAYRDETVFVGELPGEIFTDGFESGNTSAWQ